MSVVRKTHDGSRINDPGLAPVTPERLCIPPEQQFWDDQRVKGFRAYLIWTAPSPPDRNEHYAARVVKSGRWSTARCEPFAY